MPDPSLPVVAPAQHHESMVNDAGRPEVAVRVIAVDSPRARRLQRRQIVEMAQRYGGGGPAPLRAEEFEPPAGCFVMATFEDQAVGCGGFRPLQPGVAEIKRMYVDPSVRRRGIGARVLTFLEEQARAAGYGEMWLETGIEQPDAMSLYIGAGYRPRPAYGEFKDDPRNRCFFRTLDG
jgi:GNAT superfamily N-acetyltransferase